MLCKTDNAVNTKWRRIWCISGLTMINTIIQDLNNLQRNETSPISRDDLVVFVGFWSIHRQDQGFLQQGFCSLVWKLSIGLKRNIWKVENHKRENNEVTLD